jgi:MYXO-CTERM domain-containing protein
MKLLKSVFAAALSLSLCAGAAQATVLVSFSGTSSFNLNSGTNSTFLGLLNTATGNDLSFVTDMSNAAQVAAADALFVTARTGTSTLSATEITNISAFIASGKRVYLGGENNSWNTWNISILSLVGGTPNANGVNGNPTTVLAHELTTGVTAVNLPTGSTLASGSASSLFSISFANLWGASENVLSVQDSNYFQNGFINNQDNLQFATNIASWLASSGDTPAPAPAMPALFGLGLAAIGLLRRRTR